MIFQRRLSASLSQLSGADFSHYNNEQMSTPALHLDQDEITREI